MDSAKKLIKVTQDNNKTRQQKINKSNTTHIYIYIYIYINIGKKKRRREIKSKMCNQKKIIHKKKQRHLICCETRMCHKTLH